MKASIFFEGGCIGYLTNMIDTKVESKVKLEDVSVVSEFLQVFLENLPMLLLDRKFEFGIDFILSIELN